MLEEFKELLQDDALHLFIAKIKKLHLASDNSFLRVEVEVWPEQRIIMCDMTWDHVGPNSGFYNFPNVGDLVIGASAEGEVDQSFILKRLSSSEDTIPKTALTGDSVLKTIDGKKLWLTSDTRVNLSKGDTEPNENVVLGQRFKATYSDHLSKLITCIEKIVTQIDHTISHDHIGNLGFQTGGVRNPAPMNAIKGELNTLKGEINTLKSSKVDNEFILSDMTFTEKGS